MIKKEKIIIPTYEVGKSEKLPMFFERRNYQGASGKIYPLPFSSNISDTKVDKEYDSYVLENEYVKVTLLPSIGGKINSIVDKISGEDIIYNNKVIKPAMVGLCGPWVSGGIEFNWPQHHRPTTFMNVYSKQFVDNVTMGEVDNFFHMHGSVSISIEEGSSLVKAHVRVFNSTPNYQRFMFWSNTAVEINDEYAVVFPSDVNYVNDHDRRAVLSYPIAKGIYHSVRPWDYKDGTDIHLVKNIKPATSIMISKGKSDYDFVSGYNHKNNEGVVMICDHFTAPGKKLWTWGNSPFAKKWCENLTDDGSEYVELMTGSYTDNQPDFTFLAPFEVKEFDQYWYPIRDIKEIKNASKEIALSYDKVDDKIVLGLMVTKEREVDIIIKNKDEIVYKTKKALSPRDSFISEIPYLYNFEDSSIYIYSNDELLLSYKVKQNYHKPIKPRLRTKRPKDIKTNEELYINALHLHQYNHFSYSPLPYLLEGIRRDKYDSRINTLLGDIYTEKGLFKGANQAYSRAITRLTDRNDNPKDVEALYKRGFLSLINNDLESAKKDLYRSYWQNEFKSISAYYLSSIYYREKDYNSSLSLLDECILNNNKNVIALYIKYVITKNDKLLDDINEINPLILNDDTNNRILLFVRNLLLFNLLDEALSLLKEAKLTTLAAYYFAYIYKIKNDNKNKNYYLSLIRNNELEIEYVNDLFDLKIVSSFKDDRSYYYLGCYYFHKENYLYAKECFMKSIEIKESSEAYRNLSLVVSDHFNDKLSAHKYLSRAFELDKDSRIFYELVQLEDNINKYTIEDKLKLLENNMDLTLSRDDTTLKYCIYLTMNGDYDTPRRILKEHSFHTYEGGEGNLTSYHNNLYFLLAINEYKNNNYLEAIKLLEEGLIYPLNYHETVTVHVDTSQLYYLLALCYLKLNNNNKYIEFLKLATSTFGGVSFLSYFTAKAYLRLNEEELANNKINKLEKEGKNLIKNKDLDSYFGVGAPTRLPFALDIERINVNKALELLLFSSLYKNKEESLKIFNKLSKRNNSNIVLKIYKEILSID